VRVDWMVPSPPSAAVGTYRPCRVECLGHLKDKKERKTKPNVILDFSFLQR
jgi:hypothetical protein